VFHLVHLGWIVAKSYNLVLRQEWKTWSDVAECFGYSHLSNQVCNAHRIEDARSAGGWRIQIDVPVEVQQTQVNAVAQEASDSSKGDGAIAADHQGRFLSLQSYLNLLSRPCGDFDHSGEILLLGMRLIRPKPHHWQISMIDDKGA
jgi:hypothetical protein